MELFLFWGLKCTLDNESVGSLSESMGSLSESVRSISELMGSLSKSVGSPSQLVNQKGLILMSNLILFPTCPSSRLMSDCIAGQRIGAPLATELPAFPVHCSVHHLLKKINVYYTVSQLGQHNQSTD